MVGNNVGSRLSLYRELALFRISGVAKIWIGRGHPAAR